jgi:predicted CopG family antitoxin
MVKVISLSNEAYGKLKAIKNGKSFSEVVVELVECRKKEKKDIMRFAGIFKDNKDEWKEIGKMIYENRKKAKLREVKF